MNEDEGGEARRGGVSELSNGVGEAKPMMATIAVIQEIIRTLKSKVTLVSLSST